MNLLLAGAAAVDALTALSFLLVGFAVQRRPAKGPDRTALMGFVAWWWAMAVYLTLHAALTFAAAIGDVALLAAMAVRLATGPLLALAIWGLTNYLLYLYSGWRGWAPLVGGYFVLVALAYDLMSLLGDPVGVEVGAYQVTLVHAQEPSGVLFALVLASFGVPIVGASVAYLLLLRHLRDPEQRFRVLLVGVSLLVWVSAGYIGQVAAPEWFRYGSVTVLGLVVAVVVLVAYYPPRPLQQRWGALPEAAQP